MKSARIIRYRTCSTSCNAAAEQNTTFRNASLQDYHCLRLCLNMLVSGRTCPGKTCLRTWRCHVSVSFNDDFGLCLWDKIWLETSKTMCCKPHLVPSQLEPCTTQKVELLTVVCYSKSIRTTVIKDTEHIPFPPVDIITGPCQESKCAVTVQLAGCRC